MKKQIQIFAILILILFVVLNPVSGAQACFGNKNDTGPKYVGDVITRVGYYPGVINCGSVYHGSGNPVSDYTYQTASGMQWTITSGYVGQYFSVYPAFSQNEDEQFFVDSGSRPLLYDYNITINVKDRSRGINIPRVDVQYWDSLTSHVDGKTGLDGNVTFSLISSIPPTKTLIASKAGYNTSTYSVSFNSTDTEKYYAILLNDTVSIGGFASVYLDIADFDTGIAITGATVGIQNTTASIDAWRYATFPQSTILYNTSNINPEVRLSVGQTVYFAGYKTGTYTANNTGSYTIPSAVSHLVLSLKGVGTNTSAHYGYPVTITDATTGNAIGGSTFSAAYLSSCGPSVNNCSWYNQTSATGKFTTNGTGPNEMYPYQLGDELVWQGSANGYKTNGYAIKVSSTNNGVTQYISLAPNSLIPISGQFTAIMNAYDYSTTAFLSGVAIGLNTGTVKSSSVTGTATFTNLTAGNSYTLTASKSGYTTITKTFTGGNGTVVYIDVPMSPGSVNPTPTVTAGGSGNQSGTDEELAQSVRGKALTLIDVFFWFILLSMVAIVLRMFKVI